MKPETALSLIEIGAGTLQEIMQSADGPVKVAQITDIVSKFASLLQKQIEIYQSMSGKSIDDVLQQLTPIEIPEPSTPPTD